MQSLLVLISLFTNIHQAICDQVPTATIPVPSLEEIPPIDETVLSDQISKYLSDPVQKVEKEFPLPDNVRQHHGRRFNFYPLPTPISEDVLEKLKMYIRMQQTSYCGTDCLQKWQCGLCIDPTSKLQPLEDVLPFQTSDGGKTVDG
jgi:hypothetical protein